MVRGSLKLIAMYKRLCVAMVVAMTCGVAAADPSVTSSSEPSRHLISLELFGKGGLWGLGYEWRSGRFAVGSVESFYMLGGDRFTTISPYAAAYPLSGEHHRWFVHLGPQLIHRATPSPVPEWQGTSATSYDAELSTGYEYQRQALVVRGYAMGSLGGHFVPWLGTSVGWAL
jgi:hypothetical protein